MLDIITTLAPVFGLILLGFVLRRTQRLGETAASELNRFVVWLCLPALLFKVTAATPLEEIWHPDFVLVICLGTLAVFALTVACRVGCGCRLPDASIDGLGAAYANTGYVGIPLSLLVFGDEGLAPALVATLIVVCLLFSLAIVCIEVGLHADRRIFQAMGKVLRALFVNPLVMAPVLGACWNAGGLTLPGTLVTLLEMLGDAVIPCALVSLGAFLARKQDDTITAAPALVTLKLVGHPFLTWVLAYHVFQLPLLWAKSAVLLSALPTGTGPYMLAELYGRNASCVSGTVLYSTLLSVPTLYVCIWLFA